MSKPLIVVTGAGGQLGWEIQQLHTQYQQQFDFLFVDKDELDLSQPQSIPSFFEKHQPRYFVNCGAYTAVDKAETEQALVYAINAESVGVIATACAAINCLLITISTDYVFNGNGTAPYKTNQPAEPINYYGYSKWLGEQMAVKNNPNTIIIRTSWVYSTHANNFVKTMLRLMKEREELKVVSDQVGSPTYAADLAKAIVHVIEQKQAGNIHTGTYHYSNSGVISWYEFADTIKNIANLACKVLPIPTTDYPTPAKRPAYSVMDTQDIVRDFGVSIPAWKDSLEKMMAAL